MGGEEVRGLRQACLGSRVPSWYRGFVRWSVDRLHECCGQTLVQSASCSVRQTSRCLEHKPAAFFKQPTGLGICRKPISTVWKWCVVDCSSRVQSNGASGAVRGHSQAFGSPGTGGFAGDAAHERTWTRRRRTRRPRERGRSPGRQCRGHAWRQPRQILSCRAGRQSRFILPPPRLPQLDGKARPQ